MSEDFTYMGNSLQCVKEYTYLGIPFTPSGLFNRARETMQQKGQKAYYSMKSLVNIDNTDIPTMLHCFDATVKPVLMYGSEVWGANLIKPHIKNCSLEQSYDNSYTSKVELKFYKNLLQVRRNTSSIAVRGELGRYPIDIDILESMLKFWVRGQRLEENCLVKKAFKENIALHQSGVRCWTSAIYDLCDHLGITKHNLPKTLSMIKHKLQSKYQSYWKTQITKEQGYTSGKNKLRTYRLFKNIFKIELYLIYIKNARNRAPLSKLRLSAHSLAIESLRGKVHDPTQRHCTICQTQEVEDEQHFFMKCDFYQQERLNLLKSIHAKCKNFALLNNTDKFIWLLSNEDEDICRLVNQYVSTCFKKRSYKLNSETDKNKQNGSQL